MTSTKPTDPFRCEWAVGPAMIGYHDREWGVACHDDRHLFELLVLEGAQAGLSWRTVLERREGYRRAFAGFEPSIVASFDQEDQARLLADANIVRNRAKIVSAITNARAFCAVAASYGSFDSYLWAWVDGQPVQPRRASSAEVPASSPLSEALSTDLRRRGFSFVGPTICYSYLQAAGLVNDHVANCFRAGEVHPGT